MPSLETCFGFFLIDKPQGMTSRDAVNLVQRVIRPLKVGHAGTLDPLATGLLILGLGRATRLIDVLHRLPKTYIGEFRLGAVSDTEDITGAVTETGANALPKRGDITAVLPKFRGTIAQRPPAYSAKKVAGRRAYDIARSGAKVDLPPSEIEIHSLELLDAREDRMRLRVECGTGTYIRSLGRDIGEALGCGAVMTELRRTSIGPFRVEDAIPPDDLTAETVLRKLRPAAEGVQHLTRVTCDADAERQVGHGRPLPLEADLPIDEPIALVGADGALLAIAEARTERNTLHPRIVFPRSNGN